MFFGTGQEAKTQMIIVVTFSLHLLAVTGAGFTSRFGGVIYLSVLRVTVLPLRDQTWHFVSDFDLPFVGNSSRRGWRAVRLAEGGLALGISTDRESHEYAASACGDWTVGP